MVDIDLRKLPKQTKRQAGRIRRILAFILDLFIIDFFIISPFETVITNTLVPGANLTTFQGLLDFTSTNIAGITQLIITIGILILAYFSFTQYYTRQTLGMFLAGIELEAKEGELKFWQCIVRNLFVIPIFPLVLLWIIDPLYLLIVKERFSDIIAKVQVIEVQFHETK